jgi:hypothetical protein
MKITLSVISLFVFLTSFFPAPTNFEGSFSNGMKGAKFTFTLSADGKTMNDITFRGYWRCSGKLDLTTLGPSKGIKVQNGNIDAIVVEPENGGATAMRYELHGTINGKQASGTFRMNLNALGCDTYKLNWTARAK